MPKKALALVESPSHVCCRYRIRAFEPALNQSGWSLDRVGVSDARGWARLRLLDGASDFDTVILQRKLLSWWELRRLRRRAQRLVFDFDDAVLYRDSNDPRGPHCRRRQRRFAQIVQAADLVIAGNRFLAERAIEAGANSSRVMVIPTVVAVPPLFPVRSSNQEPRRTSIDHPLRLCWIGSSSTLRGLEKRSDLWRQAGATIPNLRLRVICDRFPNFDPLAVEPIAWSEAVEREALETSDAGVSWTPDDLWSRGKCGLKLLQYQAAGLPAIANPVGVHPEILRDGVSGFLAESDDVWLSAIARLADDPDLGDRMGRAAWESALANYSIDAWAQTFIEAISGHSPASTIPSPKARTGTIALAHT